MDFLKCNPKWTRQPKQMQIGEEKVVIITEKETDLWARTYYGFQNDNAPVFQIETTDKFFSFIVKTYLYSTRFCEPKVDILLTSTNKIKLFFYAFQRKCINTNFFIAFLWILIENKMGTLCLYITIILIIMEQLPLN